MVRCLYRGTCHLFYNYLRSKRILRRLAGNGVLFVAQPFIIVIRINQLKGVLWAGFGKSFRKGRFCFGRPFHLFFILGRILILKNKNISRWNYFNPVVVMVFYFTQFTIKIRDIMSNETNRNIYNLIILDESGSMTSIKPFIISGFNELVQGTKKIQEECPEQQHLISLVSFNSGGIKYLLWNEPVSKLEPINEQTYKPDDMTPLYDAIGQSVSRLKDTLPSHTPWNVLVTVLTDGEENASREYSGQKIREIIESLKPNGWTFTYIGANHDVEAAAAEMSITNTMDYEASDLGVDVLFNKEIAARSAFSKRVSKNARVSDLNRDFYESKED